MRVAAGQGHLGQLLAAGSNQNGRQECLHHLGSAESAVLQEMADLVGGFGAPEEGGVEAGEDDVVTFAAKASVGLIDHKIGLGGDDAEVLDGWRGKGADEAGVVIGKLDERGADQAEKGSEAAGDVGAAIGRGDHDESAEALRNVFRQSEAADDAAHAVRYQVNAAVGLVAVEPPQQVGECNSVAFDAGPEAGIAPIHDAGKEPLERFGNGIHDQGRGRQTVDQHDRVISAVSIWPGDHGESLQRTAVFQEAPVFRGAFQQ